MTNPDFDPRIPERIEWLRDIQSRNDDVMISMQPDDTLNTSTVYWGSVQSIGSDESGPYVRILSSQLAVLFHDTTQGEAISLFEAMSEAREKSDPSEDTITMLARDRELIDAIETEKKFIPESEFIEFDEPMMQQLSISGIAMIFGIGKQES